MSLGRRSASWAQAPIRLLRGRLAPEPEPLADRSLELVVTCEVNSDSWLDVVSLRPGKVDQVRLEARPESGRFGGGNESRLAAVQDDTDRLAPPSPG